MDESTDIAILAVLLVFVRYVHNNSFEEDLLMCKYLEEKTTGEDIFNRINNYITKHEIEWKKCTDICTDGAQAMVGKMKGVVTRTVTEICLDEGILFCYLTNLFYNFTK